MSSDLHYLLGLISEGEHQQQDFKYRVEDAVKLARSVSAFTNTDGGRLLIGVRDDGYLSGVRSEEEIFMMHQAAYRYCKPEPSIKFDTYHVAPAPDMPYSTRHTAPSAHHAPTPAHHSLRTIVIATVPRSEHRPVYAIDGDGQRRAYIRIADENILASPVHLAIWREEQRLQGTSFTYGDSERKLMSVMGSEQRQTLNQLVKHSRLPRPHAIALLARLIRFGLVQMKHENQQFLFSLVE